MISRETIKAGNSKQRFQAEIDKLLMIRPEKNNAFSLDDIGNARLFYRLYGDVCKFDNDSGCWYVYRANSHIWEIDKNGAAVAQLAQQMRDALLMYITELEDFPNKREFEKNVFRLGSHKNRYNVLLDAQALCAVNHSAFNPNPDLIGCKNGVIDLKTLQLLEPDPVYMLTKSLNAEYHPYADDRSERWESFISDIMSGDPYKIEYLQRIAGYSLAPTNEQEKAFILYGATTRNGKSTFLESVGAVLGDYAETIRPESLAAKRGKTSPQASPDLAKLDGIRFLKCAEPEKSMVINNEVFKSLTGGEPITARHLYQGERTFITRFKLYMNTNYLPLINDQAIFDSGRLQVLTFDRHFTEQEQDKTLKQKFRQKQNRAAILAWIIQGYKQYQEKGLAAPVSVQLATEQYQRKSDKIGQFMEECFIKDLDNMTPAKDAYRLYRGWCAGNGYGTEGKRTFMQYLRKAGLLEERAYSSQIGGSVPNVIPGYVLDPEAVKNYGTDPAAPPG